MMRNASSNRPDDQGFPDARGWHYPCTIFRNPDDRPDFKTTMQHPDATPELKREPNPSEPESHPVSTSLGAAGGAATGAAIGSVVGPVGTLVGGAIGAIAGGLAGHGVAQAVDPTVEDAYWRENHCDPGDSDLKETFGDYEPAYRVGYNGYAESGGRNFDESEPALKRSWEEIKGNSQLNWDKAKHATRAAWDRVERAIPGDADGDVK